MQTNANQFSIRILSAADIPKSLPPPFFLDLHFFALETHDCKFAQNQTKIFAFHNSFSHFSGQVSKFAKTENRIYALIFPHNFHLNLCQKSFYNSTLVICCLTFICSGKRELLNWQKPHCKPCWCWKLTQQKSTFSYRRFNHVKCW